MRLLGSSVLIVAAALFIAKAMAASDTPPPGATNVLYENACASVAAAYVSNTEKQHADRLPDWIRLCKAHPKRWVCLDTIEVIEKVRGTSPLTNCDGS